MNEKTLIGPWVRRFLLEHLVERAQPFPQYASQLS